MSLKKGYGMAQMVGVNVLLKRMYQNREKCGEGGDDFDREIAV